MEYIKLSNRVEMPQIGYGAFLIPPDEAERCVNDALEEGYRSIVAIPKSTHKERMAQNFNIFDFALTDDDMAKIAAMNQHDTGTVVSQDPKFIKYLIETYS